MLLKKMDFCKILKKSAFSLVNFHISSIHFKTGKSLAVWRIPLKREIHCGNFDVCGIASDLPVLKWMDNMWKITKEITDFFKILQKSFFFQQWKNIFIMHFICKIPSRFFKLHMKLSFYSKILWFYDFRHVPMTLPLGPLCGVQVDKSLFKGI